MNPNNNQSTPTIAIVGSPNVGKSSLFNRIIGKRKAIVESKAGVTRNRSSAQIVIKGVSIKLIDTGGIKTQPKEEIDKMVFGQIKQTINMADIIFFVCDVRMGATPADYYMTTLLRESSKKVYLIVNKVDNTNLEQGAVDFYQLGIGQPYAVSANTGFGIAQLLKDAIKPLQQKKKEGLVDNPKPVQGLSVAIVGRPNVGKSSFINSLFKQDIVLVHHTAGTTRDSFDINFEYNGKHFILVDTAGMKHTRKIKDPIEIFSVARSKNSIRKADVALIMLSAAEGLCNDDIKIIEYVIEYGKPCCVVVNKWDLADNVTQKEYETALKERLKLLEWVPIVFISCLTGRNLFQALSIAVSLKEKSDMPIKTTELNKLLQRIQASQRHPLVLVNQVKIYYATQTQTSPQTFTLFCKNHNMVKPHYLNFLANNIRSHFGLLGVPIRFELKEK
ncbi:MAG: ribosome biogenesis GTPase Der [Candidatus Omnitrophota bacterium]